MKTSARYFFFVLALSFSSSSWSMNDRYGLLPEIWLEMLQYLEPRNILNVLETSKSFKTLAEDDSFWANLSTRLYGDRANKIKSVNENWKQSFQRVYCFDRRCINMDTMSNEELQAANENFTWYIERLLKKLEIQTIKHVKLTIENSKDFLSMILAHATVHIGSVGSYMYSCSIFLQSERDQMESAREALHDGAHNFAPAWNAAWGIGSQDVKDAADALRLKLKAKNIDILIANEGKLINLFLLAYVSQTEFFKHFDKAFDNANAKLGEDLNFNIDPNSIITKWARCTWEKEDLVANPYLRTFRLVLEGLKRKTKKSRQEA
jgi:hypothetical protein